MIVFLLGLAWAGPHAAGQVDQSVIQSVTDLEWVTTGRAPEVEVFRFTIADTAEKDAWPTIVTKVTLHGERVNAPNYTGADFSWRLLSEDTDGARRQEVFAVREVVGSGVQFQLVFEARALLYIPSGESRSLTLLARYEGTVSGEFPNAGFNPASPRALYISADLDNGDFETSTEVDSSLLSEGSEGPELGPVLIKVERPTLSLIEDWPSSIRMDDTLSAAIEVRDRYGNLLTENTELATMTANWYTLYYENVPLVTAEGPVNGQFTFALQPSEEGEGVDNRIPFTNHARVPGGNIRVRFDVPGGGFPFVDRIVTMQTDDDSTIEVVDLPQSFEGASGFQLVRSFELIDAGTLDMLPTALYRLNFAVRIGDNCPYDATDFQWELHTDGLVFTPTEVQPLFVRFQGFPRFRNEDTFNPLPPDYTRSNPDFAPLLVAQDGNRSAFSLYAATEIDNAALDGQHIEVLLTTNTTVPFFFSRDSDSLNLLGSALAPDFALEQLPIPVISIANPTLPKVPCEGEGEGEGEGLDEGEGEGEGQKEGEELGEGEGDVTTPHTGDQNGDGIVSLSELLRVIQFFNTGGLHCAASPGATEDGFVPGVNAAAQSCTPHASDYNPQNWVISLSELLRLIQFFNSGGYFPCGSGEDGYCPGTGP